MARACYKGAWRRRPRSGWLDRKLGGRPPGPR
jgi:hypothetical protein